MTELTHALADLAAQLIAREGLTYSQAKRKAAKQAQLSEHHADMPSNQQLETALRQHLQDDYADTWPQQLSQLRQLTAHWMHTLQQLAGLEHPFAVLAVGAVVNGTATEHSPIVLHLFTDEFKHLEMALLNAGIEVTPTTHKVHSIVRDVLVTYDASIPVVMTLFSYGEYATPKQAGQGEYMQQATLAQLKSLQLQSL